MKNKMIVVAAATLCSLVSIASAQANPRTKPVEEKITINKYGQTWKVTKTTAINRCEQSKVDPKRKNWNIYCEYVTTAKADDNQCQFLFWKTDCAIRNDEPQAPKKVAVQEDGGIPGALPGVDNKTKRVFQESGGNSGVLAKAESTIGLNARSDRQLLKKKLSNANGQTIDPVRIPWCAAWMNMVLDESGLPTTGSLMARSFLAWGKPVVGEPMVGDVVVMRRGRNRNNGHVGFFYAFVDHNGAKMIAVLGGNQGKEVRISYYPITKVIAYRKAA
jgi:uncharacterized protein (TIGR02594 family)